MKKFYNEWWKNGAIGVEYDFIWKWPVIRKNLPVKGSIFDFGCGNGKYLFEISKINNSYILYGADISTYALQKAKQRIPYAKLYPLSGDDILPIRTGSIDFILAGDVIEHIFDVPNFLSEMHRILKKNGKIFISTPFHGVIKNLVIALMGFELVHDPTGPHIRFFTKKSLTSLLSKHGFHILEYNQYGRFRPLSRGMYVVATK